MADVTMPFDLEAQNQQIAQKRALQQALAARSLQAPQGQMVSGHYIAPGISGLIGQLGEAAVSRFAGGQADAAQNDYAQNYSKQLSAGLKSYLDTRDGTPGQTMSDSQASNLMNNDVAPTLADPVQANPREAIVRAMASRLPELQRVGQMDFASLLKQQTPEVKDINGQLVRVVPTTGEVKTLGDYRTPVSVNGQLVKPDGSGIVGDYRDKYGPVTAVAQPSGGPAIYGQTQSGTGEVKFAPGGSTFSPDKTGNIEALQQAGKVLDSSRTNFNNAANNLVTAQRMLQLSKDPEVNTGFGASAVTGLQALGAKLGMNPSEAVGKTQALMSGLAQRTLDAGEGMKGSFSDSDIVFLKSVANGKIDLTPEVLQHAAGLSVMAAHNQILDAMQQHAGAASVTGADQIAKLYPLAPIGPYRLDPSMFPEKEGANGRVSFNSPLFAAPSPAAPKGSAANPMTYEEYLQSHKGGQ